MGMFDEVVVACPDCGAEVLCQTKSGDCTLSRYDIYDAPIEVLADINRHAPHECPECHHLFTVKIKAVIEVSYE